jgi:hypothetical protein
MDYQGVRNEVRYDPAWIKRPGQALDDHGLQRVKIVAADLWPPEDQWVIAQDKHLVLCSTFHSTKAMNEVFKTMKAGMSPELRQRTDKLKAAGLFGCGKGYEKNRYPSEYMGAAWGEGHWVRPVLAGIQWSRSAIMVAVVLTSKCTWDETACSTQLAQLWPVSVWQHLRHGKPAVAQRPFHPRGRLRDQGCR